MNEIINDIPIGIKEYKGHRVVTFRDIDTVHQRPDGTASRNFRKNRNHFIEGVDFFKITPDEFRTTIGYMDERQQNDIILITETGYFMISKSFRDDLSWSVQRQLVTGYFKAQKCIDCRIFEKLDYINANVSSLRTEIKETISDQNNEKILKNNGFQPIYKSKRGFFMDNKETLKTYLLDYIQEVTQKSKVKDQYICPLCNSGTGKNGTGAFTFYPETNRYKCFACGRYGDIFSLYAEINNLSQTSDFPVIAK